MAIFHFTIKIVGRSKGRSVISASAYLNGDVMKNEETGKASYYTSKKEVVYTQLMMCENAPSEWNRVPEENIKHFMKSVRYKRAEDKAGAIEKFKLTHRKQKLWNEVLKVEKNSDAQLGRSFEFSLPKEWNRQEQIDYTTDFIQRNFVSKGMCADWSIHDKGETSCKQDVRNPHVHLLLTMRPFKPDHTWGNKEVKDYMFLKDEKGGNVIDTAHSDWWQDKKNPDRCGIRIPVLDKDGNQKVDSRNRKQWKREVVDATGWNNPRNCELWRSEWAKECNSHLAKENRIDHRSFARQGKVEIPTIHEGADARKIDARFQEGKSKAPSWKAEANKIIIRQNKILQKLEQVFVKASEFLQMWKEGLDDIRRKQRSHSYVGRDGNSDRRSAGTDGGDISGTGAAKQSTASIRGTESEIEAIKQRIAGTAHNLAKYRRNAESFGNTGWEDKGTGDRELSMERIGKEAERRERFIAETERRIAAAKDRIEKVRNVDERISRLKASRAATGTIGLAGADAGRNQPERQVHRRTTDAADRIARIKREAEQREQSRERSSIKERIETNKRLIAEREKEKKQSQYHNRGTSR